MTERRLTERRFIELSHIITEGMTTYPGLPAPEFSPHLTREASRAVYAPGTEFAIDRISMVGNTGTYLDTPFHRYPDGFDLAGLSFDRCAELRAVVVGTGGTPEADCSTPEADCSTKRGVGATDFAGLDVRGAAVLLHTGGDRFWGTPDYVQDAPYLDASGAAWLVEHGAALVGIDSVNIDRTDAGGERPAHTQLLAAGIPVVEHLTGLSEVPASGARFTAAPARIAGFGTFPVRAYATVEVS